ncbi:HAMP domain-containing protein [Paenibacillus sp. alder61]|uniref:histidine kinase n=1 Tax=Paenibacillus faecis TaxID=862114 RepID=A0A5D0CKJ2_9BACL|nr:MULTISPECIES: ATP-binding protein [Paenibacillus]MCA1294549.1 HAMP domain-containing protein [Paenibacillus sp. alder61]TYA10331.1 HAMP domain-containing protein [Paenibacillus faecis]
MRRNRFFPVGRGTLSPRSLRSQLLSRSLLVLALLLALIGSVQYVVVKNFLYRNQAETLMSQIRGIPDFFLFGGELPAWAERIGGVPASPKEGERRPVLFLPDTSLALISSSSEVISRSDGSGLPAPRLSEAEYAAVRNQPRNLRKDAYKVVRDPNGMEQLVVFRPADGPQRRGTLIQMGIATAHLKAIALRQLTIFMVLSLIALGGGLMLYLSVLRKTLKPLHQMIGTVRELDAGNLDRRFPASLGQSEIDRLAVSFNGMLERLQTSFATEREAKEQMRRFIADASHELRTPLTSIHGFLEVLLRGAADKPEQLNAALSSMLGEARRMKKLVEDLLTLAKLDRAPVLSRSEIRLDALVAEMEPHLRMLADGRSVVFRLAPEMTVTADSDKIKQVVLNLFHNAVQHTDPAKGRITVTLSRVTEHEALLCVQDNGPGIPAEHLPHVFERFYRSDASRTRKQGGAGLGLAISQAIVAAHGGRISAHSAPGGGAAFEVRLPAAAADAAAR